jgi:hypothetical protein
MACSLSLAPLASLYRCGAGARPDHPITSKLEFARSEIDRVFGSDYAVGHLIDSTIVRAHQHAAGAKGGGKMRQSGVFARRLEHEDQCRRGRLATLFASF